MAKKKNDKAQAQTVHAIHRARQRYGLELSKQDMLQIVRMIRSHTQVEFVERQSFRLSVFRVEIRGMSYPVVYDRKRGTIVTFLPETYKPGTWLAGYGLTDGHDADSLKAQIKEVPNGRNNARTESGSERGDAGNHGASDGDHTGSRTGEAEEKASAIGSTD